MRMREMATASSARGAVPGVEAAAREIQAASKDIRKSSGCSYGQHIISRPVSAAEDATARLKESLGHVRLQLNTQQQLNEV